MADRQVLPSNTFEQFRTSYNGTAQDVGDIANLQSASGIIASSTDVVEAIVALNASINTLDVDIAGDTGTISILDSETLTIAGTSGEIETSATGNTVTIGLPTNVTIAGNINNGSGVNLTFPSVGGTISTEGFSIALATALG
tara:strand:- start:858 stop:1283 length:426 start_codon:yes stop_codon:yes gene_type:complete